jgi:hypothetical protein
VEQRLRVTVKMHQQFRDVDASIDASAMPMMAGTQRLSFPEDAAACKLLGWSRQLVQETQRKRVELLPAGMSNFCNDARCWTQQIQTDISNNKICRSCPPSDYCSSANVTALSRCITTDY